MPRREQLQHLGYIIARRDATTHPDTWKRLECQRLATLDQLGHMSDAEWDDVFESASDWEGQFYADANESTSPRCVW